MYLLHMFDTNLSLCVTESGDVMSDEFLAHHTAEELCEGLLLIVYTLALDDNFLLVYTYMFNN